MVSDNLSIGANQTRFGMVSDNLSTSRLGTVWLGKPECGSRSGIGPGSHHVVVLPGHVGAGGHGGAQVCHYGGGGHDRGHSDGLSVCYVCCRVV